MCVKIYPTKYKKIRVVVIAMVRSLLILKLLIEIT